MKWRIQTALVLVGSVAACGGVPDGYATKKQIIDAAERCGIPDFEPYQAGAAFAAYVPKDVPDQAVKEDCIYSDLRDRQGLLVTR